MLEGDADLGQGATGPQSGLFLTAGAASRTHCLPVALLAPDLRGHGRHLLHPAEGGQEPRGVVTGLSRQVTDFTVRAAVGVILTAHGLKNTEQQRSTHKYPLLKI